jgi:uncharacterized protein YrrD
MQGGNIMLSSFKDLIRFSARLGEDGLDITDLLFNARDGRLKYLVVDTGAWLENQQTLVAASLIGAVDTENGQVTLRATPQEFSHAPRWQGEHEPLFPILASMPPLVVGPFGGTYAPLAMVAQMDVETQEPDQDPRAEEAIDRYETARSWMDCEIFGRDGSLGTVSDLLLDADDGAITHLVVHNGSVLSGKLLAVPYEVLRYRASGGHLVLDTTSEKLASAPQVDEIARLERHWQNDVHSYFMMPI